MGGIGPCAGVAAGVESWPAGQRRTARSRPGRDLRFGDIDWDRQLIHVRPEVAKSKKGRVVPIGTTRLRTLLEWLRVGPNGQPLPDGRLVFLRESGETVKSF